MLLIPSASSMNLLGRSPDLYRSMCLPMQRNAQWLEALKFLVFTVAGTAKALHLFPFSSFTTKEPKSFRKSTLFIKALQAMIKKNIPLRKNLIICLLTKKKTF